MVNIHQNSLSLSCHKPILFLRQQRQVYLFFGGKKQKTRHLQQHCVFEKDKIQKVEISQKMNNNIGQKIVITITPLAVH